MYYQNNVSFAEKFLANEVAGKLKANADIVGLKLFIADPFLSWANAQHNIQRSANLSIWNEELFNQLGGFITLSCQKFIWFNQSTKCLVKQKTALSRSSLMVLVARSDEDAGLAAIVLGLA